MKKAIQIAILAGLIAPGAAHAQFGKMLSGFVNTVADTVIGDEIPTQVKRAPQRDRLPPVKGPKHSIAVADFRSGSSGYRGSRDKFKIMLESALRQTGRFDVLNRTSLDTVIREQGLAGSGAAGRGPNHARSRELAIAAYLAEGTIMTIDKGTSKKDSGIVYKDWKLDLGGNKTTVKVNIKITDSSTGRIVDQRDITGKAGRQGMRVAGQIGNVPFGHTNERTNPIDQAIEDCIAQVADFIALSMADIPVRVAATELEAQVVKVADKYLIINAGGDAGVEKGYRFEVAGSADEFGFSLPGSQTVVEVVAVTPTHSQCVIRDGGLPSLHAQATWQR